ncbi:sigma-54 dependent transcriptional regulator [Magnetospira sp. QH-2]|uniref:sigma-54-dependent transcriptional regulator FlbD n=1 Tax=Magnetospira sp. (strain QH-2) TaxID=1288970 RepID=UPI0003E8147E|nr:sigma-54 dependent transcriptional regulator [Magnetospira sp. QH-2]CCQ73046.1 Two-component response regulator [Magnetospira sp. QH-2]
MRLLIVGTLEGQIGAASQIAIQRGAKVTHAETVEKALDSLRSGKGADLVMIDVAVDVASFIIQIEKERFHLPVVACGVGTDSQAAVMAIKAGAKEYIPLPPDAELIAGVLAAVTEEASAIVHKGSAMAQTLKLADQVAKSEASIMITGASGTGKELMARHIHKNSRRADKLFVAVNCAAIPENLLESELFGHEKGSFTGAVARRIGKFEEADGGTLLLDEISEMDVRLQAKLLRAIQEREIDRVGGTKPVKVDVRIIATSNRNMEEAVAAGQFREDLYFRINVVTVNLPSLTERPEDIAPLAEHFIRKYSEANEIAERPLADEAITALRAHAWPGNVRELENTMHRAVLLAQGKDIGSDAIMLSGSTGAPAAQGGTMAADGDARGLVGRTVAEVERDLIIDTLQHCLGNRTHAANILGISIRTLRNKLRQYTDEGIPVPMPGSGGLDPAGQKAY